MVQGPVRVRPQETIQDGPRAAPNQWSLALGLLRPWNWVRVENVGARADISCIACSDEVTVSNTLPDHGQA